MAERDRREATDVPADIIRKATKGAFDLPRPSDEIADAIRPEIADEAAERIAARGAEAEQ